MRILFIDDEPETRLGPAFNFYSRFFIISEFDHLFNIPNDFSNYDVISFDNDLGGLVHDDTFFILNRRFHQGELDLSGKKIYVHSMNPVAAERICQVCKDAGAVIAEPIPFSRMLKGATYDQA